VALDPKLVAFATNLYLDNPLQDAELRELSLLLDSREELFAYVLTRAELLEKHPDVRKEIANLAREHGNQAATIRHDTGPFAITRELHLLYEKYLYSTVSNHADGKSVASKVDELEKQLSQYSSIERGHPASPERWIKLRRP